MSNRLFVITVSGFCLMLPGGFGQDRESAPPPQHITAANPTWGREVRGWRLRLTLPSAVFRYGQHLQAILRSEQFSDQPPYLPMVLGGPGRTVRIELTSKTGEVVPFVLEQMGYGRGLDGSTDEFRLRPTGKFARGPYLAPGRYRLAVSVDSQRDEFHPLAWVGRLEAVPVEFVVLEPRETVPEELRKKIDPLLHGLSDPNRAVRTAAERELVRLGHEILPALEPLLASESETVQTSATRVFRRLAADLRDPENPIPVPFDSPAWSVGDAGWVILGEGMDADQLQDARFGTARLAPLPKYLDEPLSGAEVERLVADLASPEPHVRLLAVRRTPKTDDPRVLTALVERLADTYQASCIGMGSLDICVYNPIAEAVRSEAIPLQGIAIRDALLSFGRRPENFPHRGTVAELLGLCGPDPNSLRYSKSLLVPHSTEWLEIAKQAVGRFSENGEYVIYRVKELIEAVFHGEKCNAVAAMGRLGPDAVPELILVARDPKFHEVIRRLAIEELAHHGTAETVGPFLKEALKYSDLEHPYAAAKVIAALGYKAALPELKRLAEDERAEQNALAAAMKAFVRLADRPDSRRLLLKLLESKSDYARGNAVYLFGEFGERADVPRVIELLSDNEWYVRAQADQALRRLVDKPEGVGYDAAKMNYPELWRAWWRERK